MRVCVLVRGLNDECSCAEVKFGVTKELLKTPHYLVDYKQKDVDQHEQLR